jgi:hypothetical protein
MESTHDEYRELRTRISSEPKPPALAKMMHNILILLDEHERGKWSDGCHYGDESENCHPRRFYVMHPPTAQDAGEAIHAIIKDVHAHPPDVWKYVEVSFFKERTPIGQYESATDEWVWKWLYCWVRK